MIFPSFLWAHLTFLSIFYIPEVRFILWAPNFGAVGLARPRPADKGFTEVVGGGAAIAAQGSSRSTAEEAAGFTFKDLEELLGTGAAMEPHRSSSSSPAAFGGGFGFTLVTEVRQNIHN